eukprot:maker-scaffold_11-snap-gene-6.7-mRNA-1 protein AED:0.00 eAED:0.00 QI:79/1/1/1/0.66/0.75/4/728/419
MNESEKDSNCTDDSSLSRPSNVSSNADDSQSSGRFDQLSSPEHLDDGAPNVRVRQSSKAKSTSILRQEKASAKRRSLNKIRFLDETSLDKRNRRDKSVASLPDLRFLDPNDQGGLGSLSVGEDNENPQGTERLEEFADSSNLSNDLASENESGKEGISRTNSAVHSTGNRSRTSSIGGVKWKAILSEVANEHEADVDGADVRAEALLEETISFIEGKLGTMSTDNNILKTRDVTDVFLTVKNYLENAKADVVSQHRQQKNELLKTKAQVERLKEKLEVNLYQDQKIKEQTVQLKELDIKNKRLEDLLQQREYNQNADKEVENVQIERYKEKLKSLKKKISILKDQDKNSINDDKSESKLVEALRNQIESLEETKAHFIKVNEQLISNYNEAQARFEGEQIQWKRNWALLKKHYEDSNAF